mgnify:CR=1 FL=1
MIITRGIAMSDGINRKNHYIGLPAILNAYEHSWKYGVPSNLNHDSTKFIGWTFFTGIYMEPGKAYVLNSMNVPQNEVEKRNMELMNVCYMEKIAYLDRKSMFDQLKEMLGPTLSENAKPVLISSVAYEDKGIVLKKFPDIKENIHKGLIDMRLLEPVMPGVYKKDKYLLFAHRYFRRNCAIVNALNDSFLERFEELKNTDLKVQIALDLDLIGLLGTEKRELEYQFWWGPQFNDNLNDIPYGVTHYNNEHYDNIFSNIVSTECGWYEQDKRQTFECEEINDRENIIIDGEAYYGCRFVHSMLNPESNLPYHLDGAIRAYSDEKMLHRMEIPLDQCERDTVYTKLWRIDGDMPVSLWKELITHYYRDNMLVGEYFGGHDEKFEKIVIEEKEENVVRDINKYIPVNMSQGDGIRVLFKFIPLQKESEYDVYVKSNEYIRIDNNRQKIMETETITVLKQLKRMGLNIRIPYTTRIAHEDTVFNFPIFCCKTVEAARVVQKTMAQFCEAWKANGDDRLISYSIRVNYQAEAIQLSFAGHVNDFTKMYAQIDEFPKRDRLFEWIEKVYNVNNKFENVKELASIEDILTKEYELHFKRSMVPWRYIKDTRIEGHAAVCYFEEKPEIIDELQKYHLSIAPIFHVKNSICNRCGKSYIDCDCVKFIDDASDSIQDLEWWGATWTNRHA